MLNATLKTLLAESYKKGEKITKDFEDLTKALDEGSIAPEEIVDRVGELSLAYNDWEARHKVLVSLGYMTSDALTTEEVYQMIKEESE